MLADLLKGATPEPVTDGILLYRIQRDSGSIESSCASCQDTDRRLELFFCCSGALALHRRSSSSINIGPEDCVLLSRLPEPVSVTVQEPLVGYSLVIDPEHCSFFSGMYEAMGCDAWSQVQAQALLQEHGGFLQIRHSSWKQSTFSILCSLPAQEQGLYCVLKAADLFYLLSSQQALSLHITRGPAMPAHLVRLMRSISGYIESHLDEKITISQLCRQFSLSPTTLKNKFREYYGQPIHSWILSRRIQQAARLLVSTDMTILQIAQSVGYESTSQFNVVFRRTYGVSPSLYRKCLIQEISV